MTVPVRPPRTRVSFGAVTADDFEELLALRMEAMRDSLERVGRFDPGRARERFRASFAPAFTRHVLAGDVRVGFVAVRPEGTGLLLDHLYIRPNQQRRGIGSAILAMNRRSGRRKTRAPSWCSAGK